MYLAINQEWVNESIKNSLAYKLEPISLFLWRNSFVCFIRFMNWNIDVALCRCHCRCCCCAEKLVQTQTFSSSREKSCSSRLILRLGANLSSFFLGLAAKPISATPYRYILFWSIFKDASNSATKSNFFN